MRIFEQNLGSFIWIEYSIHFEYTQQSIQIWIDSIHFWIDSFESVGHIWGAFQPHPGQYPSWALYPRSRPPYSRPISWYISCPHWRCHWFVAPHFKTPISSSSSSWVVSARAQSLKTALRQHYITLEPRVDECSFEVQYRDDPLLFSNSLWRSLTCTRV